jgi:hypothetical protein
VGERAGGGRLMWNMLTRGESSWLCMKFAFFAGHGIFIRVLPPSYVALPVNELCILFLSNHEVTWCSALRIFRMRFLTGIFMFIFWAVVRFPSEISCFVRLKIFHEIS